MDNIGKMKPEIKQPQTSRPKVLKKAGKPACAPEDMVDLKSKPLKEIMDPKKVRGFLKDIYKPDLHRHLEAGADSETFTDTLLSIDERKQLDLPTRDPGKLKSFVQVGEEDKTLIDFLKKFDTIGKAFADKKAIEDITYNSIKSADKDNVKYVEMRFSPVYMASQYGLDVEKDVMKGVLDGKKRAEKETDAKVGLILIVERQMGVEHARQVEKLAEKYKDQGVVALDLANDEYNNPPDRYAEVFQDAKKAGLKVTVHAAETSRKLEDVPVQMLFEAGMDPMGFNASGEKYVGGLLAGGVNVKINEDSEAIKRVTSGAYNAKVALHDLQADRIGHGVRIAHDPDLIQEVKEKGIPLEMCPTSNEQTGSTESIATHPIKEFYDMGLKATINTDDPTVCGTDLTDEYEKVVNAFGFSANDVENFVMNGLDAAFLPEDEKNELKAKYGKRLDDTFDKYILADSPKTVNADTGQRMQSKKT